ncbi:MAG TPA: type II secretion system protein, partial [Humisphaera sp.]
MHRSAPRAASRRAFTLVELLVVIGIIALLMSILLPTLGRVREQANRVKCGSNLRQIGMAVVQYVQNENGYYPLPATSGARGDDIVAWQSGRSLDESAIAKYQGTPFVREVWICPADDVNVRKYGGTNAYRLSYTMNHRFRDNSSGSPKQVKASKVVAPAE